jgi:ATP-dependent Zn protease
MADNRGSIADIRKKFHQTHELISTSYHEAGHTVYGLLHFMKIQSVLVFEEKKSKRICGFTHYDSPSIIEIKDPDLFNERLHSEICLSYAGLVAEKRHFKIMSGSDKFPMFLRDGSSTDINYASILFQKYNLMDSGKKRYHYKQSLMREIDVELQDNWDAVTLVAHSLFKKKKLYFHDLRSLLSKKSEHKEFWKKQCLAIGDFYQNAGTLDEKELKSILSL